MSEIERAENALVKAIRSSEEYLEYVSQLNRINSYPELKKRLNEYRTERFLLQNGLRAENSRQVPCEYSDEDYTRFDEKYSEFTDNPIISDFLSAELSLCRLVGGVATFVTESVDFDWKM